MITLIHLTRIISVFVLKLPIRQNSGKKSGIFSILIPDLPDSLCKIEAGNEEYISLENNYDMLKKFIIQNY